MFENASLMAGRALSLCLFLLAGCGAATQASVSGKVTLDGAPLDDATISFVPTSGGQRSAAWSTIQAGQYTIAEKDGLREGPYRVEIRALRSTGEKTNPIDPTLPAQSKEALPARYNSRSELAATIKPGSNIANFELKSK
jgi:hypothetical protein